MAVPAQGDGQSRNVRKVILWWQTHAINFRLLSQRTYLLQLDIFSMNCPIANIISERVNIVALLSNRTNYMQQQE